MLGIEELEVNLSPHSQRKIYGKLKKHIYESGDLISQLLITSHSDYFKFHEDVRVYGVEHDGTQTKVKSWTENERKTFFQRLAEKE